jgi:SRSO17 transposase
MDATQIRRLEPQLGRFLGLFDDCFFRSDTRGHLPFYIRGLLSDLPRKSVEPIALGQKIPPRTLQQFVSLLAWDQARMRDRLQQRVASEHACPHGIGIIDETGCAKKGDKTPGVQRQYCGATGKIDNCVITVHLGYAADDFHCLLDNELFLPESWDADRPRCRDAGIPDTVVYRPKWRIALELLDRARGNGVQFAWLTFDEGYGGKPEFLRELTRRQQRYVAEVPTTFTGWLRPPRLSDGTRPGRPRRGRRRRLWVARPARSVADLLRYQPALREQPWQPFHVKDGQKGPMVWEAKRVRFYPQTEDGDPGMPLHLIVARNPLQSDEVKFFLSNAPQNARLETLLLVAFTRWPIERCFEDEKTELGFDHYEGRTYQGLLRHQILAALTHLFLAEVRKGLRGEKSRVDRLPGTGRSGGFGTVLVVATESHPPPPGSDC